MLEFYDRRYLIFAMDGLLPRESEPEIHAIGHFKVGHQIATIRSHYCNPTVTLPKQLRLMVR
jgi:hypothetical protein